MEADFSSEYASYLGYIDGREYGHKHPHRSFERGKSDRDNAYFVGLEAGVQDTSKLGLDRRCLVHWDNPGSILQPAATRRPIWPSGNRTEAQLPCSGFVISTPCSTIPTRTGQAVSLVRSAD
jgi:hypothetical protein